jgi:hypothetical protein
LLVFFSSSDDRAPFSSTHNLCVVGVGVFYHYLFGDSVAFFFHFINSPETLIPPQRNFDGCEEQL